MTLKAKNLDVRRKPSVEGGIVFTSVELAGLLGSVVVDYQPGNGTRYLLQIVKIDDEQTSKLLGMAGGIGWTITHLNGYESKTWVLPSYKGIIFPEDVVSWMNENSSDAYVLAEFIAHFCDLKFAEIDEDEEES